MHQTRCLLLPRWLPKTGSSRDFLVGVFHIPYLWPVSARVISSLRFMSPFYPHPGREGERMLTWPQHLSRVRITSRHISFLRSPPAVF